MDGLTGKNNFRLRISSLLILLSFIFSILSLPVAAQTEPEKPRRIAADDKPLNQKRLALVIGNSDYKYAVKLSNAANDAIDMTAVLTKLGFEVISGVDQTKEQMKQSIRDFGDRLSQQQGIGLVFYAGHGVQSEGKNYLLPVDANIPRENEIEDQAVSFDLLMKKLVWAKNNLNIVILDACRNNPFAKSWSDSRSIGEMSGLAKTDTPKGTVILYATEPNKTASDGTGRNGLFTEVLLEQVKIPNVELGAMILAVRRGVVEKSNSLQTPYDEGNRIDNFYFAGTPNAPTPGIQPPVIIDDGREPGVKIKEAAGRERDAWNEVKSSRDAQDFHTFLDAFPNGIYAENARVKREQRLWDMFKADQEADNLQLLLKEFPNGANSAAAKIKLSRLTAGETKQAKLPTETEELPPSKVKPKVEKPKPASAPIAAKKRSKTTPTSKNEVRTNSFKMELVSISAGSFMMGSSERNVDESLRIARKEYSEVVREQFDNEKPQRRITFNDGFWIGKTEVTQAQWMAVMEENQSNHKECDDCPVERVNWEDAQKFVKKLNALNDEFEYRLPSEAEWEYAARGGASGLFGGTMIDEMAWHKGNSEDKTHPVAVKEPNAYGLYDMHGNVAEWCEDIYNPTYDELPVDGTANTTIGEPKFHVSRGGSWSNFPPYMRLTQRERSLGERRNIVIGFRVAARLR